MEHVSRGVCVCVCLFLLIMVSIDHAVCIHSSVSEEVNSIEDDRFSEYVAWCKCGAVGFGGDSSEWRSSDAGRGKGG